MRRQKVKRPDKDTDYRGHDGRHGHDPRPR